MSTTAGKGRHPATDVRRLKDIQFEKDSVSMTDVMNREFQMPYDAIIMAYIEDKNKETREVYRLELTDITEDAGGEVVLYDRRRCRIKLQVEDTGQKAGNILKQLAQRAPYILMDSGGWLEESDDAEFSEAERMVSLMRELPDKKVRWIPFKYL